MKKIIALISAMTLLLATAAYAADRDDLPQDAQEQQAPTKSSDEGSSSAILDPIKPPSAEQAEDVPATADEPPVQPIDAAEQPEELPLPEESHSGGIAIGNTLPKTAVFSDLFVFSADDITRASIVYAGGKSAELSLEDAKEIVYAYSLFPLDRVVQANDASKLQNYINIYTSAEKYTIVIASNSVIYGSFGSGSCVLYRTMEGNPSSAVYERLNECFGKYRAAAVDSQETYSIPPVDYLPLPNAAWAKAEVETSARNNLLPYELTDDYAANITREDFCLLVSRVFAQKQTYGVSSYTPAFTYALDSYVREKLGYVKLPDPVSFKDANDFSSREAAHSVHILNLLGIISGRGNGYFDPQGNLTREEAAKILYEANRCFGYTDEFFYEVDYNDMDDISDWAKNSVISLGSKHIMLGTDKGNFLPKSHLTREQAIAVVVRLFEYIKN